MTTPWGNPHFDDHEAVHFVTDRASGLKAIIAMHSTALGPAAGGTRFWHYDDEEKALSDVLRLSRGMSYKNAMAGLPLGGGKAVILADEARTKTPAMIAAFGRAVNRLAGNYVTAEDVGITVEDMIAVRRETDFVAGLPVEDGAEVGGDPGPHTARGVYLGLKAAVARRLGRETLADVHVAIQGAGSVASHLARHLAADGARLSIADVNRARVEALAAETGATIVDPADILFLKADVVSPCALGAILNEESVGRLDTAIIAGAANNQLATPGDGQRLAARDILYAPDYVINAGGIINVSTEYLADGGADLVRQRIDAIPGRLEQIWDEAAQSGRDPASVADAMAQRLIGRA
ncbi:Glu/Leu/Phe/Val family dehydrogenase [Sphingomicrobium astaxanthinifaciens]|uniref:Glu/Leu/Phe/Val family dehydrogenase n=1 Tax=Sphingomicrobium astaxanthinifaciens TaxID=1227949 RepID=UPI001FCA8BAA|nr:Glu/Leu/Phe/Val dehydrogenase dimerization domain-containing protein [Sphingomicrobium astaxanthinifaciens]MCJ7420262.1 amino acid dehydrogenase [Sphingomicrobium astaxanthinifaciens]